MPKVHTLKLRIPPSDDSRAGDEATLEALNGTLTGLGTGWSSDMSLSDSIDGVTTDTIGGELRVTEVDLKNKGLTGNIEIDNWDNLKECTHVNFTFNSLNSQIPQGLIDLPKNKYLYLSRSDTGNPISEDPHESHATGSGDLLPGKGKGSEENVFTGAVPTPSDPASLVLEWIALSWTDSSVEAADGVNYLPPEIFDIPTMVGFIFFTNQNLMDKSIPFNNEGIKAMSNLAWFYVGQGTPGFFTGSLASDLFTNHNKLQFFRIVGHQDLTVDFDSIDFSPLVEIEGMAFTSAEMIGTVPAAIFDGTLPNLFDWRMPRPSNDGVTGAHPEIDPNLNDGTGLKIFKWRRHQLTSIPASLWQQTAIIQLDIAKNNLTTIGTDDLSGMNSLRYLRLQENNLSGNAPYLYWDRVIPAGIYVQDNEYTFKDLLYVPPNAPAGETLLELYYSITEVDELEYSPQKPFGSQDDYDSETSTIDFSGDVSHTDNSYTWQRSTDGGSTFNPISGQTNNSLDVSSYDAGDQFYLDVTNSLEASIGEGVTFNSVTITI